jgi:translation initiation factor IF-3
LDFNKFLYEEKKKASASKAKSKKSSLKELRFGPNIGQGDLDQKISRVKEFLNANHRVRVTVRMRGREQAFPEIAKGKLNEITKQIEEIGKPEAPIKRMGNRVTVTFIKEA